MSFWSSVASLLVPSPDPDRERSAWEYPPLSEQLDAITRRNGGLRPWRVAGVDEAMGVPAILGAVSLIADTIGSMSLEAYRNGSLLSDPMQIPRIIQRPNPHTTPRAFFRDTAYYLATRGEAWWWVAKRDPFDNSPMSLWPVPPWEIMVEPNQRNVLRPTVRWNNTEVRLDDMRQITYMPGRDGRGQGPLQIAGAAASVSVEADAFAANFYSGSIPSLIGTTDMDLDEGELKSLDAQWVEKPNNLPRWLTNGMTMGETPFNPEKAQLTETRQHQVGETARMFNMPGSLIEYNMPGASLRYQNDEQIWTDFQRRCLSPHYLEPIEQEMSDLLPRSIASRFNLKQLLRGSAKERAEYYEKVIPLGIVLPEEARQEEGYAPGHIDYAPVPQALPQAVPQRLPFERSAHEVRCPNGHLQAELAAPPYRFTCGKCKAVTLAEAEVHERSDMPVINVNPAPVTVEAPNITLPPLDISPLTLIAEESRRANELGARNLDLLEQLVKREPAIYVKPAAAPEVTVHTDSFVEAVQEMRQLMAAPRTRKVIRDADGSIIGSTEEIA